MIIIDKIHEWRYSFKVIIFLVSNYNNMTMNRLQYRHYRNYWYSTHSISFWISIPLHCRHNRRDGVSNHQPYDCLFNCLFRCKSKKISRLRVTGLCEGNWPVNSPHKWPVTRKMFPFDDVIMHTRCCLRDAGTHPCTDYLLLAPKSLCMGDNQAT